MEHTEDELISMAIALCAAYRGTTFTRAKDLVLSDCGESNTLWRMVAYAAFTHVDYIKHDRNMAMMDAEMGLG